MIRYGLMVWMLVAGAAASTGDVAAQCEGSATASTTETTKQQGSCDPFGDDLRDALQWSLTITCLDACGKAWTSLAAQDGSADAACSVVPPNYCSPLWYRYNYTNGLYAETSAWNMKVFDGCQTDYQTITSGNCGCAPDCGQLDWDPGPSPCTVTPSTMSLTLGVEGAELTQAGILPTGFFSERREVVDGVTFIMEDWAVLRIPRRQTEAKRAPSIETSSSKTLLPHGPATLRGRASNAGKTTGTLAIVIEAPVHPGNRRMIPIPEVELTPASFPYSDGKVSAAVRLDVGEDREIRQARILYATGQIPGGANLAEHLRENLMLRYASEKEHRVIVYAIVEVGAGRVRLHDSQVVLPLCCCTPLCK